MKNYRILDNFSLTYLINKHFSLDESVYYLFFKYHPTNIKDHISNEMLSLKFNF